MPAINRWDLIQRLKC